MSEPSVFTKIINGEIPCHKVYEDDKTLAFLDIHPKQPGHVLVVPKLQIDHLWDLPDDTYNALMATAKLMSLKIRAVTGSARVGVFVVGLDVPHAHIHLVPFNTLDEYLAPQDMSAEPNHAELAKMAEKLIINGGE